MTRETLYNIRKFLVKARVASHTEEQEFFEALEALDRMIKTTPSQRIPQQVNWCYDRRVQTYDGASHLAWRTFGEHRLDADSRHRTWPCCSSLRRLVVTWRQTKPHGYRPIIYWWVIRPHSCYPIEDGWANKNLVLTVDTHTNVRYSITSIKYEKGNTWTSRYNA